MKKLFLISALIAWGISFASAQFFVGGAISLSTSGGSTEVSGTSTDKPSRTIFNLAPMGGMFLSDKLAAGVSLGYGFNRVVTPGNPEVTDLTTTFSFSPFARYYALRVNKFSVFAQGSIGYWHSSSSNKTGSVTVDGPKTQSFGISAFPGVSYDILEWLSLEAAINGLTFGASTSTTKTGNNKNTTNSFQLGADTRNIVTSGLITVGAIVKF